MVHPVALAPAAREYALEKLQGLLLLPQLAVKAGRIDQGAHVVGIQVDRPARPLDGTRNLSIVEKGRRADGREEALTFVADYLSSLITATEIESAKTSV